MPYSDDYTPYGANGFGRAHYDVTAIIRGEHVTIYEGFDQARAESQAISAYLRHHRNAYVSILQDGSSWRHVQSIPHDPRSAPQVTESPCCLHAQCGQIPPTRCYCRVSMTPEEIARYERDYA